MISDGFFRIPRDSERAGDSAHLLDEALNGIGVDVIDVADSQLFSGRGDLIAGCQYRYKGPRVYGNARHPY